MQELQDKYCFSCIIHNITIASHNTPFCPYEICLSNNLIRMSKGLGISWGRRLLAFQIWKKTSFMDKHITNLDPE